MQAPLLPTHFDPHPGERLAAPPDLPELLCNDPDSFAWGVLAERHPALVSQIHDAYPYQATQHTNLDHLLDEASNGAVTPLPAGAPDRAAWDAWGESNFGKPWFDTPFLWAESYFYRRLLDAVGFFTPGPWYWVDPFAQFKAAELGDPALDQQLRLLDELSTLSPDKRLEALLQASLWGNRADLGFKIGAAAAAHGEHEHTADLVADDTTAVMTALTAARRQICVVADNAGRELLSDLILIDRLLAGGAATVSLHVKPTPYYVSDATTADVVACLRRLAANPGDAAAIADRLRTAMREGRLTIFTHWFYCAPLSYHHTPRDLAEVLASASLVLLKGDLNYRRLVGDCAWPPTTAFASAVDYFPAPVAALRTLKSDVVIGLTPSCVADLDNTDDRWRTNGTRGWCRRGCRRAWLRIAVGVTRT